MDVPSHEPQECTEQQLKESLARLEQLQEQIDTLRSAIPSIVSPLTVHSASKVRMFAEVKKAALQTTQDLQTFRENWQSDETQDLLAKSRESLQRDGNLAKANKVAKYGWAKP